VNPILQKLLAATGLTRRGDLVAATEAIQRTLAEATVSAPPGPFGAEAPTSKAPEDNVLDGLVREIDVIPVEPPPVAERPRTGGFGESTFTAAAGTRRFKLFEPAGFEGRSLPLLVMLHGCTQDPDDFAAGTRMNVLAQEQGLLRPLPGAGTALERAQVLELVPRHRPAARPGRAGAARRDDAPCHGDAADRCGSSLGRRPVRRRRHGGDPGARVL
jgi:hypothetical protein